MQFLFMLFQQFTGLFVLASHRFHHFFIHPCRRFIAADHSRFPAKILISHRFQCHHAKFITHAIPTDHGPGQLGGLFDVIAGSGGHIAKDDLLRRDRKYKKAFVKLDDLTISKIHNFHHGFLKLLADRNNHIIGAVIAAPNAELLASELSVAIRHNLTALELASTPHPINNYNHLIKLAAKQLLNR